jgi:hypothetical protein
MKLENLGAAFDEVKEIIRKSGRLDPEEFKKVLIEYEVTEEAINATFKRETGRLPQFFRVAKNTQKSCKERAISLRVSREKYFELTHKRLQPITDSNGVKFIYVGTYRDGTSVKHDFINVETGQEVAWTSGYLKANMHDFYKKIYFDHCLWAFE